MRICLCAILFLAAAAHAQEDEPRKRMVFPARSSEPEPPRSAKQKPEDPGALIGAFFMALKSGQVDAAYDALVRNTIISERKENVRDLKESTKKALDSYGPVAGYDVVGTLQVGSNLVRQTCISLNEDLPLRWRFYFYRSGGVWKIVDIRVDDGLVELFEEAGRKKNE
ncbi:MAG: hypothetical protein WCS65_10555 [Verrucomicrobiae bacterium]